MRGSKLTEARVMELMSAEPIVHKFGNTQLDIPDGEAAEALEALRSLIDDDDCAGQGKNVEGNHVTVRYGLSGDDHNGVFSYFAAQAPFECLLGKMEMFPPSEASDRAAVLKVPVMSDELLRMNDELEQHGAFIPATFDYNPHATVAYVKPEAAFKYVGLSLAHGKRFSVSGATICRRDGTSLFVKFEGQPVPEGEWKPLGDGFGNPAGQDFGESVNSLRFDQDQPRDSKGQWTSSGTTVSGDVKHTEYKGPSRTIVVDHDTKENKITIKHLDAKGDLLVQQTHDSVGAARKELAVNGIDHKFYALPSKRSFDPEQPRDKSGAFSMGNVAVIENEKQGTTAYVTKFEGKFHVNVLKGGKPYLPGALYDDKQEALDKAHELVDKRQEPTLYECRSGERLWF